MHLLLTSHIGGHCHAGNEILPEPLLAENGFLDKLKTLWPDDARCLMIASDPDDGKLNDLHAQVFEESFRISGLSGSWDIWDDRTDYTKDRMREYDFVLLLGGHVPTQNHFFQRIHLREKLEGYGGIVCGISAGTMNCADTVYAMPELPGEAVDPEYIRFCRGLGLTNYQIIPHYQYLQHVTLDGMPMIQEIARGDSQGRAFLLLPDGSYLYSHQGMDTLYGEGYVLENGFIRQITKPGECRIIQGKEG
ncbi:MAG: dipeptidase E [Clostridiales bacterium]|nr:dipeptidase E [Clostridiales bacterium]